MTGAREQGESREAGRGKKGGVGKEGREGIREDGPRGRGGVC